LTGGPGFSVSLFVAPTLVGKTEVSVGNGEFLE